MCFLNLFKMPKLQFETTSQDEINICRVKHLAMINNKDASKKGDYISLGMEWLVALIENMPKEQVYSILKIKQ